MALPGLHVTQMGKQVYILQDMKFGGTPLHWSCSRQVIETLVGMECDINSRNFDGRTALHIMVVRNRLECVVALLSHNADVNIGDHDGNTPLHLAVTQRNAAIVQALVIFGADLSYKYDYLWYYLCFSAVIRRSKEVSHNLSYCDVMGITRSKMQEKLKLLLKVTDCEIQCFEIAGLVTTSLSCLWYKLLLVILLYFRK